MKNCPIKRLQQKIYFFFPYMETFLKNKRNFKILSSPLQGTLHFEILGFFCCGYTKDYSLFCQNRTEDGLVPFVIHDPWGPMVRWVINSKNRKHHQSSNQKATGNIRICILGNGRGFLTTSNLAIFLRNQ